eukprot:CAMPEP_0185589444 /NCGR_PEP_ID=MMETSP0434-20130131/57140_1 /TAXON_ID=626734 ORGANISM="Favella taraikaensis, Strain Fe Narragansett Bay" /NCGR_SAMPLE_ID=MMETSP0434 /ASSEMBLY_ACC=CAM_ASM_000379 /LENGTH=103 /DNA_ID=CAMNT_0028212857 /DNA_START=282 /DNA_END=593 /DNA_ORIENTATION=-
MDKFVKLHQKMDQAKSQSKEEDQDQDQTLLNLEASGDYHIDYKCANCILEFAKNVVGYLEKQHFLIVYENERIKPTPLGKAAFASSISPEESMLIFEDLVDSR